MFSFPHDLYVDIRIEESFKTEISFKQRVLQGQKVRSKKGAFIRIFDGQRWYYSSTTDLEGIQSQINTLAKMANPNPDILDHPIVKTLEVHKESSINYEKDSVTDIPVQEKQALLGEILQQIEDPAIVNHNSYYVDNKTIKSFYSSKGSTITFDQQTCGLRLSLEIVCGENKDQMIVSKGASNFADLKAALF